MYGSGFRGTVVILAHITAQVSVSQLLVTSWKNKASQLHLFALAPVAHLDRASVYGTEGRGFESLQAHHPRSKCRDAAKVKISTTPLRLKPPLLGSLRFFISPPDDIYIFGGRIGFFAFSWLG